MTRTFGCSFCLLIASSAQPAVVDSIELSHPLSVDGISMGSDGDIYASGGWSGPYICRVGLDGSVETIARGLSGPILAITGPQGDLFVSEFNAARVSRIDSAGVKTVVAETPQGPAGLVFDDEGALYVASFGSAQGDGDTITRVSPGGEVLELVSGQGIAAPIGLALDDDGRLYVANSKDGKIHRVSADGEVSLLATIPGPDNFFSTGHLVFAKGALYASGNGSHKVYRVTLDGEVSVVAGTGKPGEVDGDSATALLRVPNGLTASRDGDELYVVSGAGRLNMSIRRIRL